MSTQGRDILKETGAEIPRDDEYPTGKQYVEKYLQPLQNFLFKVRYFFTFTLCMGPLGLQNLLILRKV